MLSVVIYAVLFSVATVVSILLLGSREIIGGVITPIRMVQIIFTWQFILGAFMALIARLLFMLINNALYRMPEFSDSSTTITALITTVALVFVIIANYYFLNEQITFTQAIGAAIIFFGIFLVTS
jgi:drug/metabolite transporter (DMT)-like permease